ncbi:MAG: DUF1080 domain-containing protein [Planctomycetes bacterium]|nr:DUF1080 domain-containing protein [Planctomycetota bacterium]
MKSSLTVFTLMIFLCPLLAAPPVELNDDGFPKAVVTPAVALVHTGQILPWTKDGKIAPDARQATQVLENLDAVLRAGDSSWAQMIRLNIQGDRAAIAEVKTLLKRRLAQSKDDKIVLPALTILEGNTPVPGVRVAIDAVSVTTPVLAVDYLKVPTLPASVSALGSILPAGPRAYIAGQAEKGATPAEATRKTLESLRATLKYMGLTDAHVVQAKCFLSPMSARDEVVKAFETFFGAGKVPPLVFVAWKSDLPIEIELIAHAPVKKRQAWDEIDYLTPPGMTSPTIYSRVARIHSDHLIYIGSITPSAKGDAKAGVTDVFEQLGKILDKHGSDFRHLAKATYFVGNDDFSKQLNALRPNYYDPRRAPSASKALVENTEFGLCIDMIATPSTIKKEGKPEFGHEMTADMVRDGWLCLFDSKTTFGWEGATADKGRLTGGRTKSSFSHIELSGEFAVGGEIKIAGKNVKVEKGPWSLTVKEGEGHGPIILGNGVVLRQLFVKPLGMTSIMPGANLDGWKKIDRATIPEEKRPKWTMKDGVLDALGGPGALEYPQKYGNFIIQIEVRSRNRHANGGLFIRSIPGDFMNGYEAQIHSACENGDPSKPAEYATGGIDDRQNARRLVSRDFEPFLMTVIADGPHIATWVNGYQVTDWIDTRKEHENPRKGLRLEPGTIQLQAHDPATHVEFRRILVKGWK